MLNFWFSHGYLRMLLLLGFEISGGGGAGTCRCHLQAGRIHRPLDPGGCPRRSQRRRGDGIQPRRPLVQPRWPWIWQGGLFPPLLLQSPAHPALRPPWARPSQSPPAPGMPSLSLPFLLWVGPWLGVWCVLGRFGNVFDDMPPRLSLHWFDKLLVPLHRSDKL